MSDTTWWDLYVCAVCGELIAGLPHSDADGEDVHPECCVICLEGELA